MPADLVVAYEPVWAIGTGRTASGADAAAMADVIRATVAELGPGDGAAFAQALPVLYGGSVTSAAIGEFLAEPAIDGALVGGASLKVDEMAGIVARAGLTAGRDAVDGRRGPVERHGRRATTAPDRAPHHRRLRHRPRPGGRRDRRRPDAALAQPARRRGRTAASTRRVRRSACPSARWATARSGTSTSAPAARCSRTCRASTPRSRTARSSRTPSFAAALDAAARRGARVHLVGLIGPGGVHSTDGHAVAIAAMAREVGVTDVVVHALLDGRDTPPRSADGFVRDLEARLAHAHPGARIATIGGRYYGMDRDQRWERTQAFYDAMVGTPSPCGGFRPALDDLDAASPHRTPDALAAIAAARERGENDEFVRPTRDRRGGRPRARRRPRRPLQLPRRPRPPADPRPGR